VQVESDLQLCFGRQSKLPGGRDTLLKHTPVFLIVAIVALGVLALGVPGNPASVNGAWLVDPRHSDAQIISDGTTDFGKKKIDIALGFGRLNGELKLDDTDAAKSRVDLRIYPATPMSPTIAEDGNFQAQWLTNLANHTLVCFHFKKGCQDA
jgi:polyisoprenoid-binding protein YceI